MNKVHIYDTFGEQDIINNCVFVHYWTPETDHLSFILVAVILSIGP